MKLVKLKTRAGQSLIEVMIGLAIGAILIGSASLGITFILRSSATNQNLQGGARLNQDTVDRVGGIAGASWQDIYGLTHGTSTAYFANASGTKLIIVEGKEGIPANEISDGLTGHWKFDEATSTATTTTFDASGKANHGTLTGGTKRATTTCKVSFCLDFDGIDDYVDAGTGSLGGSITITAWIYPRNISTDWAGVVNKNNVVNQRVFWFGQHSTDGHLRFGVYLNNETETFIDTDTAVLVNNNWYHIVATYDGNFQKIYINGSSVKTSPDRNTVLPSNTSAYWIGKSTALGGFFNGFIDDVRVYNRALSADEVERLWNSVPFTRYFVVENVNRDTNGNIVTSGGNEDPSTQKITSSVEWPGVGGVIGQLSVVDYITRWANRVFHQSDWSGGSGETGVIIEPSNRYSNATSVSNPAGSIRIEGL